MIAAYIRVSSNQQSTERQRLDLLSAANGQGIKIDKTVEETISSRSKERDIFRLVAALREGDMIMVTELSRLARSVREINEIVNECRTRGATIWVTTNNLRLGDGMDIAAEAMLFALATAAQVERDLISERTTSGLQRAREQGKKLGRPFGSSILRQRETEIERYVGLGINKSVIARLLGVSRGTVARYLNTRQPTA